jgi:hypothetical protein
MITRTLLRSAAPASRFMVAAPLTLRMPSFSIAPTFGARYFGNQLASVLATELREEKLENEQMQLPTLDGWEIQNEQDSIECFLTQKTATERITVRFELSVPEFNQENMGEDGDEAVEEEEPGMHSAFHVIVQKNKVSHVLVFECQWEKDGLMINKLSVSPNEKAAIDSSAEADMSRRLTYPGPDIHDIDENLRFLWYDYLAEKGVNQQMQQFMEEYSKSSEQLMYTQWLEKLHSFVK